MIVFEAYLTMKYEVSLSFSIAYDVSLSPSLFQFSKTFAFAHFHTLTLARQWDAVCLKLKIILVHKYSTPRGKTGRACKS